MKNNSLTGILPAELFRKLTSLQYVHRHIVCFCLLFECCPESPDPSPIGSQSLHPTPPAPNPPSRPCALVSAHAD
jgi:hypothetical protein